MSISVLVTMTLISVASFVPKPFIALCNTCMAMKLHFIKTFFKCSFILANAEPPTNHYEILAFPPHSNDWRWTTGNYATTDEDLNRNPKELTNNKLTLEYLCKILSRMLSTLDYCQKSISKMP
ncbi:hypothetical protein Ahy_A05g022715 isoform C [Arachis hypogaea]|uniref:Secreted protein n=1 Tax=Arachis hypogaea TaxID=3818 RepID=A0A445D1N1_ARAHY|nr:hypothetical protein Ahy_A05g022715 isoform C [Arachis hypogaea]